MAGHFSPPLAPSAGGTYSLLQLGQLWVQAGGKATEAPLMAAIAMAESGGRATAHNPSGASGLWQILGQPFAGNVYDPLTNARMAVAKYNSQGLGAWTTYTSGAYRQYLSQAQSAWSQAGSLGPIGAVGGAIGSAASSVAGAVTGPITSVTDLIGMVTSGAFWLRVLEVVGGLLLLAFGLRTLAGKDTTPVTVARGAARNAGKAAVAL